jgi:hypothetical protein
MAHKYQVLSCSQRLIEANAKSMDAQNLRDLRNKVATPKADPLQLFAPKVITNTQRPPRSLVHSSQPDVVKEWPGNEKLLAPQSCRGI